MSSRWSLVGCALAVACADAGPSTDAGTADAGPRAERIFATGPWADDCLYASPVRVRSQGDDAIFLIGDQGRMALVDPTGGATIWEGAIDHEPKANLLVYSTPGLVADRWLVLGWQVIAETTPASRRYRHEVAVFDLEARAFAPEFERLTLAAEVPALDGSGVVTFDSNWQLMRGTILPIEVPDRELGLTYVPLGNGPSEQPFHGWVFELDMDAWRDGGASAAIASVLCTTRENGCGAPGNRDATVCGGGVWNAAGIQRYDEPDGHRLLVPTGNGRVDYDIGAYAHSVLRVGRGLALETGCDPVACADFDARDPSHACLASCTNVFSARLPEGEPPLAPEDGTCDGLTFLECYGALDADLGANAPAIVELPSGRVFVQPGKDGALYLIDGEHMGTLHQRVQVMDFCGTPTDTCGAFWIGMFVTQPALAIVDGAPVVIVASVMADRTHPSGISAFDVRDDPPRLELRWQVPSFDSEEAVAVFRHHPGRPMVAEVGGEPHVFVVETRRAESGPAAPPGMLWGVRVRDGRLSFREALLDAGQRFAVPLASDGAIYVNTCARNAEGAGRLEAFRFTL
jgi:hypothetical protein